MYYFLNAPINANVTIPQRKTKAVIAQHRVRISLDLGVAFFVLISLVSFAVDVVAWL